MSCASLLAWLTVLPASLLWDVPLVHQGTDYSCGAAATGAVADFYGKPFTEAFLIRELGTNPERGTDIHRVVGFLRRIGVPTTLRTRVSLDELARRVAARQPPIVVAQAWPEDGDARPVPYAETWDLGHYLVVIGLDSRNVYFMDPWLSHRRGYMPREEFLSRWHHRERGEYPLHGVALLPETSAPVGPSRSAPWVRIP